MSNNTTKSYSFVVHVRRNKNVFQTRLSSMSDITSTKREACTKVNFHFRMILIPITKMVEFVTFKPWTCPQNKLHELARHANK